MFGKFNQNTFIVGGAVRNEFLGLEPKDIDFVIEGITPEEYEKEFPHHKRVGEHFPVYLS